MHFFYALNTLTFSCIHDSKSRSTYLWGMKTGENSMEEKKAAFERILIIMDELRAGCPWDKEQTMESLRVLTIEETYELAAAITANDLENIREELGDVLLHILFYSKIASETNTFDIADVIDTLCEKMIRRHPHIYGDTSVNGVDQVMQNWEAIKLKEKGEKKDKSILSGVPRNLPALPKALRIQQKAKKVGFEWDTKDQVWDKVLEEIDELKEAVEIGQQKEIDEEFGDVLFALANYARFTNVDPEGALEKTNQKFIRRFKQLEGIVESRNGDLTAMSLEEMDAVWNEVKALERKG